MPFLEEQESAYLFMASTIWTPIHMSLDIRICFSRLGLPPQIISVFNHLKLLFDRAITGVFFLFSRFGPAQVAMSSAMAFLPFPRFCRVSATPQYELIGSGPVPLPGLELVDQGGVHAACHYEL